MFSMALSSLYTWLMDWCACTRQVPSATTKPSYIIDARINPDESNLINSILLLDDILDWPGMSGLEIWDTSVTPPLLVGVLDGGYTDPTATDIKLMDNAGITTYTQLEESYGIINTMLKAVADLESKQ